MPRSMRLPRSPVARLTPAEFEILGHFSRFPALDVRQVAAVANGAPASLALAVRRLVTRGFLRGPVAARSLPENPLFPFAYSITRAGRRALRAAAAPR